MLVKQRILFLPSHSQADCSGNFHGEAFVLVSKLDGIVPTVQVIQILLARINYSVIDVIKVKNWQTSKSSPKQS